MQTHWHFPEITNNEPSASIRSLVSVKFIKRKAYSWPAVPFTSITTIITQKDYKLYTENILANKRKKDIRRSRGKVQKILNYKNCEQSSSWFCSFANIKWERQKATKKGIKKVKPCVYLTIYFLECIFCEYLKFSVIKKFFKDHLNKLGLKALSSWTLLKFLTRTPLK